MKSFLTAYQVAKLLSVDRSTVGRWIQQGKVDGVMQNPKSRNGIKKWLIPFAAYEKLVRSIKLYEGNQL